MTATTKNCGQPGSLSPAKGCYYCISPQKMHNLFFYCAGHGE